MFQKDYYDDMIFRKIYLICAGIIFGGGIGIAIFLILTSIIHNLLMIIPNGIVIEKILSPFARYFGIAIILISIILFINFSLRKYTRGYDQN